jgi:hypothetical protein
VKLPAGKVIVPGVIDSTVNTVEHPEVAAERILNFAQCGRARERHRRRRLRLRHLCWPRSGRQQDRLAQAAIARRRRPPRLRAETSNSRAGPSSLVRLARANNGAGRISLLSDLRI